MDIPEAEENFKRLKVVTDKMGYEIYPVSAVTKPDVLDTVKVKSNYKFKTSGYGLSQGLPKIKIFTDVSSNQTSKYQTTMRIDCIIVRPHDAPVSEAREIKISY